MDAAQNFKVGDKVTHWTHPHEDGEVVSVRETCGETVHNVVWPGSKYAIPYGTTAYLMPAGHYR